MIVLLLCIFLMACGAKESPPPLIVTGTVEGRSIVDHPDQPVQVAVMVPDGSGRIRMDSLDNIVSLVSVDKSDLSHEYYEGGSMKSEVITVIMALVLIMVLPQAAGAYTGREIMDQSEKLASPDSAESTVTMRIYKGDKPDEKAFTIFAKNDPNDDDKVLLSFHKPTRIQLLTHTHKGREDDQWLVLSSGRIKRIASADKGKAFVHSHFYYEDLGSRDIDDYDYTYLGDAQAVGVDCYKVESVRKAGGEKVYDKSVLYVRKSDFFIVRVDFYQNGQLRKYLENFDVKVIEGILTPMRVVMSMADGRGRTELNVEKVEYNKPIPDSRFNKEALR